VIVGLSLHDNRFFWWIGWNAALLLVLQPYLMRLSRTVWLSFFVKYDKNAIACEINTAQEQAA
jgi:hypothetical protein